MMTELKKSLNFEHRIGVRLSNPEQRVELYAKINSGWYPMSGRIAPDMAVKYNIKGHRYNPRNHRFY